MKKLIVCALLLAAAPAFAEDLTRRFGAGVLGGAGVPIGTNRLMNNNDTGYSVGGWLAYGLDKNWTARLSYDTVAFDGPARFEDVLLGLGYNLAPDSRWNPTVKGGLGMSFPRRNPQGRDTTLGATLGFGIERFLTDHFSVGAGIDYLLSNRATGARETMHALRPGVTLGWWFGACAPCEEKKPAPAPVRAAKPAPAPAPAPAAAPAKVEIRLAVNFDTAKDEVKPQYDGELQKVAKFLKKNTGASAEIEGHTDNVGGAEYNRGLSQRRAAAVRQALIERFGVDGERLTAKGYGPDRPIADNGTAAGRAQNRRVVASFTGVE
jgi:OmpA-OmpF porin, OOP family